MCTFGMLKGQRFMGTTVDDCPTETIITNWLLLFFFQIYCKSIPLVSCEPKKIMLHWSYTDVYVAIFFVQC